MTEGRKDRRTLRKMLLQVLPTRTCRGEGIRKGSVIGRCFAPLATCPPRYAGNLLELESCVQEEARARADIQDKAGIAERKGDDANQNDLRKRR